MSIAPRRQGMNKFVYSIFFRANAFFTFQHTLSQLNTTALPCFPKLEGFEPGYSFQRRVRRPFRHAARAQKINYVLKIPSWARNWVTFRTFWSPFQNFLVTLVAIYIRYCSEPGSQSKDCFIHNYFNIGVVAG
jgi:hypothetical protein